jgi:hypothetical protein
MMVDELAFSDISSAAIEQAEEYLVQLLQEEYPSLDLTKSRVIRDQIIRPAAILRALDREDLDTLRASFSPLSIVEDPTLADDDMVDAVYSNYRIERFDGTKASGLIAIIISSLTTTAVPEETVFTANGLTFVLTQAYVGVTDSESVVSSSERLIEERSDGSYVFTVPVVASAVGEAYRIERGTRFTAVPAIPNTVDLQAAQDFSGGTNEETNAELTARVQTGVAPTIFSARTQVAALLQEQLPSIKDVSQVGLGDTEMLRDRHNLFLTSTGGKADVYVQTADYPTETKLTKTCTYMGNNQWQFSILRDDVPGFYLVTAVVAKDTISFEGSLAVDEEIRGLDRTLETDWVQDIADMLEGAYTRYQTAVVKFTDPSTPTGTVVGATTEYDVYVLGQPSIKALNDLTIDRARRPHGGDYLIRAAVPALTSVTMLVQYRPGVAAPSVAAIQAAVASRANSLGFLTGKLYMSHLVDAVYSIIDPKSAVVSPLDMQAYIYPPDLVPSGRIVLRDTDVLTIPDTPARGVTQRTTCFFLAPSDVAVTVEAMPAKSIG